MATSAEHQEKALHDEEFIRQHDLGSGDFADWAVTGLFYSALHWLRAVVVREGYGEVHNYGEETKAAEACLRGGVLSKEAWRWYRHLKDESRSARYGVGSVTAMDYDQIYETSFSPFRAFILTKLGTT